MHIKKSMMPKTWPVPRKSKRKRYIAVPTHAKNRSITLLYLLRDILKIANTRRELKKILQNGDVMVNEIVRKEDTFPIQVLDTISLEKIKRYYRLEIVNQKFQPIEISKKEAGEKIVKIIGKKTLTNENVQMNLEDGSNFLTKEPFSVGDSALVNQKSKKILKLLPLKVGAKVEVSRGKHSGKKGKLVGIETFRRNKGYKIKLDEQDNEVVLPYKTVFVIG
jgi:small subunit ribosomal protein S4e